MGGGNRRSALCKPLIKPNMHIEVFSDDLHLIPLLDVICATLQISDLSKVAR